MTDRTEPLGVEGGTGIVRWSMTGVDLNGTTFPVPDPDGAWVQYQDADRLLAAGSLDAAWAEAEAALPEGWRPRFTFQRGSTDRPLSWDWLVTVEDVDDDRSGRIGTGPTPAAALRALAAALSSRPTGGR